MSHQLLKYSEEEEEEEENDDYDEEEERSMIQFLWSTVWKLVTFAKRMTVQCGDKCMT